MSSRIRRSRDIGSDEEPSVNLTPLIDVVFCILIMFIIVAPLLELDEVALAETNGSADHSSIAAKEGGPISIHVHQDNTVWLNQRAVELSRLPELLKYEKQLHPGARPQVYHDKRAHFGTYQSIKNAAETAGFEQMDVILKPA
jgi:biopolymer transport protein ExbD